MRWLVFLLDVAGLILEPRGQGCTRRPWLGGMSTEPGYLKDDLTEVEKWNKIDCHEFPAMWMINLLLGECTANPSYSDLDLVFVKNFLEQELGFAVLIVLITTCLGKDDWKAELSQLQLLVVAAVVLYKTHGSCIRCENLRSSCITLQYEVLQHLDTRCEQLTTHLQLQRSQCQDRCCNKEELFRSYAVLNHFQSNLK